LKWVFQMEEPKLEDDAGIGLLEVEGA